MSRRGVNGNRVLGNRLWDADGIEWTADRTGGHHLDPDDVRDLVAVRWLDADDAALALRHLLTSRGPFCENPLGGSVRDEVSGSRRLVVLEETH